MDASQAIAAGAALSAFSLNAQHDRLLRLHFPYDDGPDRILLPNRLKAHEEVSRCLRFDVDRNDSDKRKTGMQEREGMESYNIRWKGELP